LSLDEDLKDQRVLENLKATTNVGIVYITSSNRNLFYSVISSVSAALAAGNCVVLELPSTLTQVYSVVSKILPTALDAHVFAIASTKPSASFLSKCTLLDQTDDEGAGAKVVAIVDRTANISQAASAVGLSRTSFKGKSSYAPDIVLVNEFVADDFILHLVQAVTSPMLGGKDVTSPNPVKARLDSHSSVMKELEGNEGCKVVMSGANGSIVEIRDREKEPLGRKIDGRVIIVFRVTSLDDAIDLCNGLVTYLEASFVFAATTEANYLSRFIDARISYINHIPIELLVGPFAPKHPSIPPNPSPRYPTALFRSPKPRTNQPSPLTSIFDEVTQSRSVKALDIWTRSVLVSPLPAVKQADGQATGFFDQAFMAVGAVALTLIGGSGYGLFWFARRHWGGVRA